MKKIIYLIFFVFSLSLVAQIPPNLIKMANEGDADAQDQLGLLYMIGEKANKDPVLAVKWFKKAASQNHLEAQYHLARAYIRGEGVIKDLDEGVFWAKKASYRGHAASQNILAARYALGEGVGKDRVEAMAWLYVSAAYGDDLSIESLSELESKNQNVIPAAKKRSKELFKIINSNK